MKQIPLTQGKVALVDDADYEWLAQRKWCANKSANTFYALHSATRTHMHSLIFGGTCDHRNRNGLDNQRKNLRRATPGQQNANRGLSKNNASGFKGVSWQPSRGKWIASIKVNKRSIFLGRFHSKYEAARAYDLAATRHFGEFAVLNATEAPRKR